MVWAAYIIYLDQSEPSNGLHKRPKPWFESSTTSHQTAPNTALPLERRFFFLPSPPFVTTHKPRPGPAVMMGHVVWDIGASGEFGVGDGGYYFRVIEYEGGVASNLCYRRVD